MSFRTVYTCDECKKDKEQDQNSWFGVGYLNKYMYHACSSECFLNIASRLVMELEMKDEEEDDG